MFYQHNMGVGGWAFMAVANIIIWSLIIAFIVRLARDLRTLATKLGDSLPAPGRNAGAGA